MNKSSKYEMHVQIYIIQMYLLLRFLQWLALSLFLHVINATPQTSQLIISVSACLHVKSTYKNSSKSFGAKE